MRLTSVLIEVFPCFISFKIPCLWPKLEISWRWILDFHFLYRLSIVDLVIMWLESIQLWMATRPHIDFCLKSHVLGIWATSHPAIDKCIFGNRYIDSERRFQHVLEACGVYKALADRGVKEGDTVVVGEVCFVYMLLHFLALVFLIFTYLFYLAQVE